MSETLILESVNPQYDERLFIEFQEKYKFTTCCVQKLFFCFCFDIQNNICTQHVVNLYFSGNLMNNLLSYRWLTDSRMRASEKDLPVQCGRCLHALHQWSQRVRCLLWCCQTFFVKRHAPRYQSYLSSARKASSWMCLAFNTWRSSRSCKTTHWGIKAYLAEIIFPYYTY